MTSFYSSKASPPRMRRRWIKRQFGQMMLSRSQLRAVALSARVAVTLGCIIFTFSYYQQYNGMSDNLIKGTGVSSVQHTSNSRQQQLISSNQDVLDANSSVTLPHIPPRIWQTYTPFHASKIPIDLTTTWILRSPSYAYSLLDEEGGRAIVARIAEQSDNAYADALQIFDNAPRWVLRSDLVRFVLLAAKGGIYTDIDTSMIQPLAHWVPEKWKEHTKLIVGIEADQIPPVAGTTYPVQFATWTMAGAPGHPIFWKMVERSLSILRSWPPDRRFTDSDVLNMAGPASWTEMVFSYLSEATGTKVTSQNVTGMREPKLFHDVLVLPIDGFATGVPHSGASTVDTKDTLVRHHFHGSWKGGN